MTPEGRKKQRVNASAVLDEYSVARIKRNLLNGLTSRQCAESFGVATETIRKIGRGDSWVWVEPADSSGQIPNAPSAEEIQVSLERLKAGLREEGLLGEGQAPVLSKLLEETNAGLVAKQRAEQLLGQLDQLDQLDEQSLTDTGDQS
jgi:hypothetical protein